MMLLQASSKHKARVEDWSWVKDRVPSWLSMTTWMPDISNISCRRMSSLAKSWWSKSLMIARTWCIASWVRLWISLTCSWAASYFCRSIRLVASSLLTARVAKRWPRLSWRSRRIRWRSFSAKSRLICLFFASSLSCISSRKRPKRWPIEKRMMKLISRPR